MTMRRMTASAFSIGLLLGLCGPAAAEQDHNGQQARLYLPITGTASGGATFAGTLSVQKFAAQNGQVVAIGMVSGTVTGSPGSPLGTVLVGPVVFPVQVGPGSSFASSTSAPVTAQQAQTCDVLNLSIGAVTLNALGLQITTQPISIDLSGVSGGTNVLGQLICTILQTVGNVVGLVNLLNQLLGTLGGLTG